MLYPFWPLRIGPQALVSTSSIVEARPLPKSWLSPLHLTLFSELLVLVGSKSVAHTLIAAGDQDLGTQHTTGS